jgi:hypothetical protein
LISSSHTVSKALIPAAGMARLKSCPDTKLKLLLPYGSHADSKGRTLQKISFSAASLVVP